MSSLWIYDKTEEEIENWPDKYSAIYNLYQDALCIREERDALAVKCAELEKTSSELCRIVENEEEVEPRKWALLCARTTDEVIKISQKNPKTCLADIQARAVEEFAQAMEEKAEKEGSEGFLEATMLYTDCHDEAIKYARHLRKQAGGCDE